MRKQTKTQHKFKKATKKTTSSAENRKVKNAKKREYNGVAYRSGLEAVAAQLFEEAGLQFEYEKYTFTLVDKFHCPNLVMVHKEGSRKGKKYKAFEEANQNVLDMTYTPDFVNMELMVLVETKGLRDKMWVAKEKLFKKYMVEHNLNFDFYAPSTKAEIITTIEMIKSRINGK